LLSTVVRCCVAGGAATAWCRRQPGCAATLAAAGFATGLSSCKDWLVMVLSWDCTLCIVRLRQCVALLVGSAWSRCVQVMRAAGHTTHVNGVTTQFEASCGRFDEPLERSASAAAHLFACANPVLSMLWCTISHGGLSVSCWACHCPHQWVTVVMHVC
jgi:hypothetical protein